MSDPFDFGPFVSELHRASDDHLVAESLRRARRIALLLMGASIAATVAGLFLVGKADAHDAPTGWKYPFECCSNMDCRPVTLGPDGVICETSQGYQVSKTGELIPYSGDTRLRESPDGMTHWCSVAGEDDGRTLCLFVPPNSY